MRLPKSSSSSLREDKEGRLSRHSSGRFSDKFSTGEPDPGVISEDEDEFRVSIWISLEIIKNSSLCIFLFNFIFSLMICLIKVRAVLWISPWAATRWKIWEVANWRVVALHAASIANPNRSYQGKTSHIYLCMDNQTWEMKWGFLFHYWKILVEFFVFMNFLLLPFHSGHGFSLNFFFCWLFINFILIFLFIFYDWLIHLLICVFWCNQLFFLANFLSSSWVKSLGEVNSMWCNAID